MDERSLIEHVTRQRWYGAKSRTVSHSEVLDTVTIRQAEPQLSLALVEMRFDTGAHDIYQLLVSRGDEGEQFDGLAEDAGIAREILSAMRAGVTLQGRRGRGRVPPGSRTSPRSAESSELRVSSPPSSRTAPSCSTTRSSSRSSAASSPGSTRSSRCCASSPSTASANIPALGGWYAYSGGPLDGDARDPAGVRRRRRRRLGARARRDRVGARELPRPAGAARRSDRRTCTARSASDPSDPAFAPEEPSVESLGLLTATVDEEIARVFLSLPEDDERLAPIVGRGEEVREQLRLLTHAGSSGRVIRTHGDYHLGQALWSRERLGHPRLRGRARADARRAPPQALAAARRRRDAPLLRLRGERPPSSRATPTCPRTGRSGRARGSSRAISRRSTRRCCRPATRRSSACSPCSSSRRRSTSSATSSTTARTGLESRSRVSSGSCDQAAEAL